MNERLEESKENRQGQVANVMKYFSSAMGVLYMVLSVVLYFYPFIENIEAWAKIALSVLLFVYGAFRLYRAWR